ncbi:MAG TPA: radical SAM protein [Acidobacteriota bacterium]|nr:radical SAM protein [Acidobacteriota bacterium]
MLNTACGGCDSTATPAIRVARHLGAPRENAQLARVEYQEGKVILESLPPIITFALTTFCNNRIPCLICDRNVRPASADSETSPEVIRACEPLLKTALYVFLHCGGEPMFTSHFDDIIAMIEPPTRVSFATNAMLLTRRRADQMLAKDVMGTFVVSLDAATPETYGIMRPSSRFNTVIKNISYYTSRSVALNRASGILLNMTICEANLSDVPKLVELALKVGAVGVDYNHLNTGLSHVLKIVDGKEWRYERQATFHDPVLHDELVLEAYHRAKASGILMRFVGRPFIGPYASQADPAILGELGSLNPTGTALGDPLLDGWNSPHHYGVGARIPACLKPWRETVIQPNGDVRVCYFHDQGRWTVANLVIDSFMSIWNSDVMIGERTAFLLSAFSDRCRVSAPCLHRGRQ